MKKKTLLLIGLASTLSFTAKAAVDDKEIAACAAKENTVERITCYDNLAKTKKLVSESKINASTGKGKWHVSEKTDPLTDKSEYFAMLDSDSEQNRRGTPFALIVSCRNNKTSLYVYWGQFITTRDHLVTYRIGKESAQTSKWNTSTDHQASFFPDSPITVLKKLINENSFIANVTPYSENPITAIFDTQGANVALSDIRQACHW